MTKPTILFIASQKNYDIFRRNSAIDSFICSIFEKLKNDYNILINGEPFIDNNVRTPNSINKNNSLINYLKKHIPIKIKKLLWILDVFINDYKLYKKLNQTTQQIDLIFELSKIGSSAGYKIAKKLSVPYIVYFDAPHAEEFEIIFGFKPPLSKQIIKRENLAITNANRIVVYSERIIKYWFKRLPELNKKKFSPFQTLDYSRLTFYNKRTFQNRDTINFGFIGSFLNYHKVEILVKLFNQLKENTTKNIKLFLVGTGEEYSKIKKMVELSPYKDDIIMTGFVDKFELNKVKEKIDIGLQAGANWYNIPTKVFEYAAYQMVIIAPDNPTKHFGFIDNENCLLFNELQFDQLLKKMLYIVENSNEIKRLALNGYQKVLNNNNIENAILFYKNLFNSQIK